MIPIGDADESSELEGKKVVLESLRYADVDASDALATTGNYGYNTDVAALYVVLGGLGAQFLMK